MDKLPHPPVSSFVRGVAKCGRDSHRKLTQYAAQYGGIYSIRFYHQKVVVLSDPTIVHQVLAREGPFGLLDKAAAGYFGIDVLTFGRPSLLSHPTHSDAWRHVRKSVSPAFATRNIKNGLPHVVSVAGQLVSALKALGPEAVVDMDRAAQRESLDVIGRVGFGKDYGATRCLGGDEAESALSTLQKGMVEAQKYLSSPLRPYLWFFPDVRKGRRDLNAFHSMIRVLLAELRARGPPADDDTTIAAHLLRMRDPATGLPLSDEQLLPEVSIIFAAGLETTGHTIAWTLYLISQHPEAEARVVSELDAAGLLVTGSCPHPRTLTFDDLGNLPYLSACIKESMRMYPVAASGTSREAPAPMLLGGYHIPKGTQLWSLARMNYTAALALLLSSFSFRLAAEMGGEAGVRASECMSVTLQPSKGLLMHCIPRPC
ncbi:hypothetical protein WJX81_005098 [Elliptochloris bilobata]|uniref:Cytochrome P450 n=1 Tax=Elliptochloris bilobata TaxID=381761 RepID=A0AAW1QBN0_9CHLO